MDVYTCIAKRRDTRHFTDEPVPEEILEKAIMAAHHGPSVGLTEPWRFVRVKSEEKKEQIKNLFLEATKKAEESITEPETKEKYKNLKLEAILDAPIGLAVFCDHGVLDDFTIGTIGNANTLEWSCACAIQNMWLSLTAEGYGAGWVSIMNYKAFADILDIPENWKPLGYFCIGKPATDYDGKPMLQNESWKKRSQKPIIIEV